MKRLALLFLLLVTCLLFGQPLYAADLPIVTKAPARIALPGQNCPVGSYCGLYAGLDLTAMGDATNLSTATLADFTAMGTKMGVHGGYIAVTPTYLLGVEGRVTYQTSTGGDTAFGDRFGGRIDVKGGGTLSALFGQAPAVTTNTGLFNALITNSTPYLHAGNEWRAGQSQSEMGVGVFMPLPMFTDVFATVEYSHGNPQNGLQQFNEITLGISKLF